MVLLNDLDTQVLIACVVVVGLVIIIVTAMLWGYTIIIGVENTGKDGRIRIRFELKKDRDVCVYF